MNEINGWNQWSKHVLAELVRLNECYEKLHDDFITVQIDIARLKTEMQIKSGIWGALAGVLASIAMYILKKSDVQ